MPIHVQFFVKNLEPDRCVFAAQASCPVRASERRTHPNTCRPLRRAGPPRSPTGPGVRRRWLPPLYAALAARRNGRLPVLRCSCRLCCTRATHPNVTGRNSVPPHSPDFLRKILETRESKRRAKRVVHSAFLVHPVSLSGSLRWGQPVQLSFGSATRTG